MTLRAGPLHLGLRMSAGGVADELRQRLSDLIVAGEVGAEVPPNLSVLAGSTGGPRRSKHQLFWQNRTVARSTSLETLEESIRLHLAPFARRQPVVLSAVPLHLREGILAVDLRLRSLLLELEPRFRRLGRRMIPSSTVPVDDEGQADLGDTRAPLIGIVAIGEGGAPLWLEQLRRMADLAATVPGAGPTVDLQVVRRLAVRVPVTLVASATVEGLGDAIEAAVAP